MNKAGKYRYLLYGWVVGSDIRFAGLPEAEGDPEIHIRIDKKAGPAKKDDAFSFTIKNIGDFKVGTREIIINPFCDESLIGPYILGTAFGVLIHKRSMIVLHGSALQFGDGAVIFSGPSGTGKSTLAAAFIKKGFKILSDDVCVVSMAGMPMVHPSYPQLKLWLDASDRMDVDWQEKNKIAPDEDKFSYSVSKHFCHNIQPLKRLYVLHRNKPGIDIQEIRGMEKFDTLAAQTYRLGLVQKLSREKEHFEQIALLAEKIKVFNLFYPGNFDKIEEVTEQILLHNRS